MLWTARQWLSNVWSLFRIEGLIEHESRFIAVVELGAAYAATPTASGSKFAAARFGAIATSRTAAPTG